MLSELERSALELERQAAREERQEHRSRAPRGRRKPQARIGDHVLVAGRWYLLTRKEGQRCHGKPLGVKPQAGFTLAEHRFTSRQVERVFRELGVRAPR